MFGDGYLIGRLHLFPFPATSCFVGFFRSYGEWLLLIGTHWLTWGPLLHLVESHWLSWSPGVSLGMILLENASGPGTLASRLWQVSPTTSVAGWASRWLHNPAFWPAHVFGLEPFPWKRAEPNRAICSLTTVQCLWAEVPSEIMKYPPYLSQATQTQGSHRHAFGNRRSSTCLKWGWNFTFHCKSLLN